MLTPSRQRRGGGRRPRGWRTLVAALTVLAAHVMVFLWLLRTPPAAGTPDEKGVTVTLAAQGDANLPVSVSAPSLENPSAADAATAVASPPSIVPTSPSSSVDPPPTPAPEAPGVGAPAAGAQPATSSPAGELQDCAVLERLQAELTVHDEAREAVGRIPASALSVAHALLLWDSRWVEPEAVGGAAVLEPIRRVILTELARTAPSCLLQPISGPRLLILNRPEGQTVLAIGSGAWTWGALLVLTPGAPPNA